MGLKCMICGSSDFEKSESLFVCKQCGTTYSLEEAKQIIVSDKSENESNKIDNLLINAKRFIDIGQYNEAYNISLSILRVNPDNCNALLYSGISIIKIKNTAIAECIKYISEAIKEKYDKEHNSVEFYDFSSNAINTMKSLIIESVRISANGVQEQVYNNMMQDIKESNFREAVTKGKADYNPYTGHTGLGVLETVGSEMTAKATANEIRNKTYLFAKKHIEEFIADISKLNNVFDNATKEFVEEFIGLIKYVNSSKNSNGNLEKIYEVLSKINTNNEEIIKIRNEYKAKLKSIEEKQAKRDKATTIFASSIPGIGIIGPLVSLLGLSNTKKKENLHKFIPQAKLNLKYSLKAFICSHIIYSILIVILSLLLS